MAHDFSLRPQHLYTLHTLAVAYHHSISATLSIFPGLGDIHVGCVGTFVFATRGHVFYMDVRKMTHLLKHPV